MKKKKFIIIILIFLTLLVTLTISLKILLSEKEEEEKIEQELIDEEEYRKKITEEYFSDKICPQGMATLYYEYNGKNDRNDLYRGLYNFVGYITQMYPTAKDYDISELEEYYNGNSTKIISNTGIQSFEEFEEFIQYLKDVGFTSEDVYKYCEIDTETYEETKDYLIFNLSFYYEGKDKLINLKTYFANNTYTTPELKFEPITQ